MNAHTLDLDDILQRVGLAGTAMIVFSAASALWGQGEAFRYPANLLLSVGVWAFGIAALGLSLTRPVPRRAVWLVLAGLIAVVLVYAYLQVITTTPLTASHTDNEMIAKFSLEALKHGVNPYQWNFSDMLRVYRDRGIYRTPFLDGAYQHRLTYPILPTLVMWGFDLFGIGQVRIISAIAYIALLIMIFLGTPARLRPVILLPMIGLKDHALLVFTLSGVQDIIWSALLVGMIYAWKRPVWRAVLFGLACAYRQQPWFVAPFLLIFLWHGEGSRRARLREIGTFVGISAGIFVIINLPFFVWDPAAWMRGALEPSYAAFNYTSQGIAALTQYGVAPLPRQFYSALQLSSCLILLVLYGFYARWIGQAFWVFPGVFFWLYYRGLTNYWLYWLPVMLSVVAKAASSPGPFSTTWRGGDTRRASPLSITWREGRGVRLTHALPVTLVALIAAANVALAVVYLRQDAPLKVEIVPPLNTMYLGLVNEIEVMVSNHSDDTLTARFAVQSAQVSQPLPWHIVSGPEQLLPGESDQYMISTDMNASSAFHAQDGARLVVSDAGNHQALRAVIFIPPQAHADQPDQVANADYRYWPQNGRAPEGWTLEAGPGRIATLSLSPVEGRSALALDVESNPNAAALPLVRVYQRITFPGPFAVWVYPTLTSTDLGRAVYGIEFDDGVHRLWVLFGASDGQGVLESENTRYVFVRAPLNEWSRQEIDLPALYAGFGWALPTTSLHYARDHVVYVAPHVTLSWMAASRFQPRAEWIFGPVEQANNPLADPDTLIADALAHPDRYYVNLGDQHRLQRNYQQAADTYRKALSYNPASADGYFGLAESLFWLGDWPGAVEAFQTAIRLGYFSPALAYRGIGWASYNQGDYLVALSMFEQAISLLEDLDRREYDSTLADAYTGVGRSWWQLGDCAQAAPYFEQAIQLVPALRQDLAPYQCPQHQD
jgi:hypothetical protein